MKFIYKPEGIDGLILINEYHLKDIDEKLLYELDILLDRYGESELIYDFPNEKREDARRRETREIVGFCNSGKMVVLLYCRNEDNCEIHFSDTRNRSKTFVDARSGKLILVNAGELIQCVANPGLEMEPVLTVTLTAGTYSVHLDGINSIGLRKEGFGPTIDNVIDFR